MVLMIDGDYGRIEVNGFTTSYGWDTDGFFRRCECKMGHLIGLLHRCLGLIIWWVVDGAW